MGSMHNASLLVGCVLAAGSTEGGQEVKVSSENCKDIKNSLH